MARRLIVALAALLLAAACGNDDQASPGVGSTTTSAGETTGSTAAGTDGSPRPTASGSGPRGNTATSSGGGSRPTSGPPDASTRALIDDAANNPVGAFAGVVLAPGVADRIVLDVRSGAGASPDNDAVAVLAQHLRNHSGKAVSVTTASLRGVDDETHTADEIRSYADAQGTDNGDGVAVIHLFYLGGRYEKDGVLGVAVRADTMAVFPDVLADATSPFVTRERLARAVSTHELGHLLGLVDVYLDKNRDDPEHEGHSRNSGSVMFWAVETSLVGQVLGGPPPVDFDAADVADLREIRNGAAPSS